MSAAQLAYDRPSQYTYIVDQPHKSRGKRRIASPFTVESRSPYRTVSPDDYLDEDMSRECQEYIVDALIKSGMRIQGTSRYVVQDVEKVSYPDHAYISHLCNIRPQGDDQSEFEPAALSVLPDDATCSQAWINQAMHKTAVLREPKKVIIIAFNYDSDALLDSPTSMGSVSAICLRANRDLMISSLENTKSDSAFVQVDEPDVHVEYLDDGKITVEVAGFDTFDPKTGNLRSGDVKDIECWMLDTNYNRVAFMARRIHFPNGENDSRLKRYKRSLSRVVNDQEWERMLSVKTSPFAKPQTGQIAVRIITTTAVEMTTVVDVD